MTKAIEEKSKKPRNGQYQPGDEYIDEMLKESGISREAIFGAGGLIPTLSKRILEKALAGELTHHLGYEDRKKPMEQENWRNGYSKKTLLSEDGRVEISIPRDRQGDFEPLMIAKGEKRFKEFDERIIDMYAGGMSVREVQTF